MLNVMEMLQSIPGESIVGANLHEHPTLEYSIIKDARFIARQEERNNLLSEDSQLHKDLRHWQKIIELAPQVLIEQSKDLTIVAWLIEALVRLEGFAGLRQGIELLHGLITQYWHDLYPRLDEEEGIVTRLAPLVGLNGDQVDGTLISPLNSIPLTKSNNQPNISAWHYHQALNLAKVTDQSQLQQLVDAGSFTLEKVKAAVLTTPALFFEEMKTLLIECINVFDVLTSTFEEVCGVEFAPPTSNILKVLRFCLDAVQAFIKMKPQEIRQNEEFTNEDSKQDEQQPKNDKNKDQITSKQQAFQTILSIAKYFKQYEPHSPVPYLLEQAVHWGSLPLPNLLAEILPDPQSLSYCYRVIGIKPSVLDQQVGSYLEEQEEGMEEQLRGIRPSAHNQQVGDYLEEQEEDVGKQFN